MEKLTLSVNLNINPFNIKNLDNDASGKSIPSYDVSYPVQNKKSPQFYQNGMVAQSPNIHHSPTYFQQNQM